MLQGEWKDEVGLGVEITGASAVFGDAVRPSEIGQHDGAVVLRGARLEGDLAAGRPVWRSARGVERWSRPAKKATTPDDVRWRFLFHRYKADRLLVRRELLAAVTAADSQRVAALRRQWDEPLAVPTASDEQRARLATGRNLVPGMCFVHRLDSYRGVILACEPWCTAPEAWRLDMGVEQLPRKGDQPFYHCVVERGGISGSISFEAEDNIQLVFAGDENLAFPVSLPLVDGLFERCDKIGGYLPKAPLVWRGKTMS